MPAKMIDEAEYQAQMAKLLRRIEELDSAAEGEAKPTGERLEKIATSVENQIEVMRSYLSRNTIHDLINALTGVGSYVRICKKKGEAPQRKFFTSLSGDLKGVLGGLEPSECDLRLDIINPSLCGFYGIIIGDGMKEGYKVFVPAGEIRARVVGNLLFNAREHKKTGSKTVCDFESLRNGLYEVSVANGVENVIPTDKLDAIFKGLRLGQGDSGSGLGLQNARSVVGKYGGMIGADSYVSPGPPEEPHFSSGLPLFKVTFGLPKYR